MKLRSMKEMSSVIRGSPQIVRKTNGECYTLHDPFLATVLDFVRRCLDQLAQGLHLVVSHTLKNGVGFDKRTFFRGEEGEYVSDIRRNPSGHDIMYLLKNIRFHSVNYSQYLRVQDTKVKEVVDFLLNIRNELAHESYARIIGGQDTQSNASNTRKFDTTNNVLDNSIELLSWFEKSRFYQPIKAGVKRIKQNLTDMKDVLQQLKRARQSAEDRERQALNTRKAEELLQFLIEKVREEAGRRESFELRPMSHLVNMVLAPRITRT